MATFAFNSNRHLELYFAVPCMGAVLHPLNLRLPAEQLIYVINHAEDKVLCVDPGLWPAVEKLAPHLKTVQHFVVLGDHTPETSLGSVHAYEALLAERSAKR